MMKGNYEIHVSEGGEADLQKHASNCAKNPRHEMFIPVTKFRFEDLPEGFQDNDLYELIKAIADLTVRIAVKMTSPHRPESDPSYNLTTLRRGKGDITLRMFIDGRGVNPDGEEIKINREKYPSSFDESTKTCPCIKCQHSDKPNNVWWEMFVVTATHVVYDEIEASHTSCRFYFDEENCPLVTLDNLRIDYVNAERDWCQLKYATCDQSIGDKLCNMEVNSVNLLKKVRNNFKDKSDSA